MDKYKKEINIYDNQHLNNIHTNFINRIFDIISNGKQAINNYEINNCKSKNSIYDYMNNYFKDNNLYLLDVKTLSVLNNNDNSDLCINLIRFFEENKIYCKVIDKNLNDEDCVKSICILCKIDYCLKKKILIIK